MFDGLTNKLGNVFDRLRRQGALTEADVQAAMREIRIAMLEADVALPVVKDFVAKATERAIGQDVLKSITPGQQVVKIVHDTLVEMLGETTELEFSSAPSIFLMVGLQGSGKTTTTGKLAKRLSAQKKKVLMASLDVQRPGAQEQLAQLGTQTSVDTLPIVKGEDPLTITKRAIENARKGGYDVLLLDSAGRLSIDDELMNEISAVKKLANPIETLLVADSMTGQDAVNTARNFDERVGISGIVLTRIDGDSRGGAALSMRMITGKPIKLLGVGEKLDALETYHPDRLAGRILDMGDVVSLVEKVAAEIDQEEAAKVAAKMQKGQFDLEDYASQLKQMQKMGGMGGIMNLLPGMGKIKDMMANAPIDESIFKRQMAMISSMTAKEKRNPDILNASRKRRIASGSGTTVQSLNQLLKQHQQMQDMMKRLRKMGKTGLARQGLGALMGGGNPFGAPGNMGGRRFS
ncbi:MAG TPA: signal recognition particle protein [Alphaproteobacteria bacterium]